MKTTLWTRRAEIDGVSWDLELRGPWLDAWRNGVQVKTVYSDGRESPWTSHLWPEQIVAAWQEMLDVMRREAGR